MSVYSVESRYNTAKVGTFRGKNILYTEYIDYNQVEIIDSFTITVDLEFRPDLISLAVFGSDKLWWLLMSVNKFDSISSLYAGRTIKVPNISGLV
jgi:hypothetical protein